MSTVATPMIDVTCGCGKVSRVSAQHAGKSGKCQQCGARVQIPSGAGQVAAVKAPVSTPPAREPWYFEVLTATTMLALGAAMLLSLGGVCFGIWSLGIAERLPSPAMGVMIGLGILFGSILALLPSLIACSWVFLLIGAARDLRVIRAAALDARP